jgi:hypothetical protein
VVGLVRLRRGSDFANDTGNDTVCTTVAQIRSNSVANGGRQYEAVGTDGSPGFTGQASIVYPEPNDHTLYLLGTGSICRTGAVDLSGVTGLGRPEVNDHYPDWDGNTWVALKHRAWRGCMSPDVAEHEQQVGPL